MKIEVYFREELKGTGTSRGNEVFWDSPSVKGIAFYYERKGYKGEQLLKIMLQRLQGMWWAQEI
jgi:hypothetical protein